MINYINFDNILVVENLCLHSIIYDSNLAICFKHVGIWVTVKNNFNPIGKLAVPLAFIIKIYENKQHTKK